MQATHCSTVIDIHQALSHYLGLAPFLRMNLAAQDLRPLAEQMLARLQQEDATPELWQNLATVMLCLGQKTLGLQLQQQALQQKRIYSLPLAGPKASLRLLLLMQPGDLAANTPIDCLLEQSDIEIIQYYVTGIDNPLDLPVPEHDVLMVGLSETDDSIAMLQRLEQQLQDWPVPVINPAHAIPHVGREIASRALSGQAGLCSPIVYRASHSQLQNAGAGITALQALGEEMDYPFIIRPTGSHGGHGLSCIQNKGELQAYLDTHSTVEFFVSRFIDYRNADGMFRKFRIVLIDGKPFLCHMAISDHWMVHYLNAGMYDNAARREEEAAMFANFSHFAQRHKAAFETLHAEIGLDYLGIDCAETADGQLLIFEVDHAMILHAMDDEALFPFKQAPMQQVRETFCQFLEQRISEHSRMIPCRTKMVCAS